MAFVKEDVKGADKALFDSFGFVFDNEPVKAGRFTTWTVDRKRDIYFTYLGGGALERPSVYGLIWKNNKIIITTEIRGYIDKNPNATKADIVKFAEKLNEQMLKLDYKVSNGGIVIGYAGRIGQDYKTGIFNTIDNIVQNSNGQFCFINNSAENILNDAEFKAA